MGANGSQVVASLGSRHAVLEHQSFVVDDDTVQAASDGGPNATLRVHPEIRVKGLRSRHEHMVHLQQGSSQSSGKSSQSALTCPLHDAGTGLHVYPLQPELPAQIDSPQQLKSVQSLAVHGQHSSVPGSPPL